MANGTINLKISTSRTGNALESTASDAKHLDAQLTLTKKTLTDLGKAAQTLGGTFGGVLKNFIGGSFWMSGAQSLMLIIDKMKEHNELMRDARLAAKGLSAEYMNLEAAARGYQRRVESWRKAKAEADKAEAGAAAARKKAAEEELNRRIAHLNFEKQYLVVQQKIADERRAAAAIGADEVAQARARAASMREAAALAVQLAERDVAAAKAKGEDTSLADASLDLAKERVRRAAAEADKVVADAERRAMEAVRETAEERKRLEDEAEKKRRDAQRKTHLERIEQIRAENAAALKKLDQEIAKAKQEADILERNAQRARGGKTFGEWARGERDLANEQRKSDRRQANVIRNAEDQIKRLESEQRRLGKGFNPRRAAALAKLREFVADQDPNNNPALRKARELEEKRKRAEEQAQKDIAAIKKALEAGIGL